VAERTNPTEPLTLWSLYAAGSRPVVSSGTLGFESQPRRLSISTNPDHFHPACHGYIYVQEYIKVIRIDIHNYALKIEKVKTRVKKSKTSERNKQLIFEFMGDCKAGWGDRKLTDPRISKLVGHIKILSELVDKDWYLLTQRDLKSLLAEIDSDPKKGEWTQHDYRLVLRKFVTWLRNEQGYPEGYPDGEELSKMLHVTKYPVEVSKIKVERPNKLKPAEEIPTEAEMQYLSEAAINPRNKAFFEMAKEVGIRIGGIGSRQIKHITFDELGAKVTIHDKTMRGEPVRFVSSASYLHFWLDNHPFRDEPEAPLWIDLEKTAYGAYPLDYNGFRAMIKRTVDRHNKRAERFDLPKITKRIHSHHHNHTTGTVLTLSAEPAAPNHITLLKSLFFSRIDPISMD
jgi:integrase/recombinase XerD